MARTTEQILQQQIGAMTIQLAAQTAQLEAQAEELATLRAAQVKPQGSVSQFPPVSTTQTAVGD